MAFTDNCDVFGAVHEAGFNLILRHLGRQRPSLFNYGTQFFESHPDLLCRKIDVHPEVPRRGNPLVSAEDPLPIFGTDGLLGLDFCFQITGMKVDFHKGNVFNLPPELNPPLQPQRLALFVQVCAGIACPDREIAERFGELIAARVSPVRLPGAGDGRREEEGRNSHPPARLPPRPIPGSKVICFCLDVFAVAHVVIVTSAAGPRLAIRLDSLEIVDIKPEGLENSLECYIATTLRVGILPRLRIALDTMVLKLGKFATLLLSLTPTSANVPNNPAIEDDQVKVFINVGVSP
jgi:hypothetical protein